MLFSQRPSTDPNKVRPSFVALSEGGGKKKPKLSFVEDFMLGGIAAGISKTAAAPIERIKLLLQNQDEMLKKGTLEKPYNGIMDCGRRVIAEEGFISFWRGNLANVIRYFPTQALNFAFNKQIKAVFNQTVEKDGYFMWFLSNMASGGIAGALSLSFVYSLDFARTRLANDLKSAKKGGGERQYKGLVDVYVKTIKSDGVGGLYRGFVISCVGIVAYRGCYFGFFDTLKPLVLGDSNSFLLQFLLGWVVTIVASQASYPLDTIRRRMMMKSGEAVKYKGSMDCAMQILRNEGWKSFFKGAGANVIRAVAGAGVLSGFEKIQEFYVALRA